MKRASILLGLAVILLLAAMGLKGRLLELPPVPPAVAAGGFQTHRAMARLERVLGDQRPHPVDSAANDGVRERLIGELRAVGLTPRVRDDMTCGGSTRSRTISCARIRNVTVTLGPAEGKHVLLVSHYDSTPVGPGASDDGIGVAVMLETAALLKDSRLARPVTLLFNEGEETGLLGARAFLERDPLAARVDTLINVESRGVSGPAIMFETSRPNAAAIAAYKRAVARPAANSLTTDFYKLVPNSTDVAVFEEQDWTILNFAVIGNETRYHSPGDTIAALDPRSVRHMGDQTPALTRDLAGRDRTAGAGGTTLYADLLGRSLLAIPMAPGIALLATLLALFAWLGWQRRDGLARAAVAIGLGIVDSAILAFLCHAVVGAARSGAFWRAYPGVTGMAVYVGAIAACLLALIWLARGVSRETLRVGYWLIFLVIGAAICLAAPGATIFFLVPPLVAGLGMVAGRWLPMAERIGVVGAAVLLFLSWAPLLDLTETLLDFDAAWIFAPVAALILLPALIELKVALGQVRRRIVVAASGVAVLAAWLAVAFTPAYGPDRKQRLSIEYAWDESARKGQWLVYHDGGALPSAFGPAGKWRHGIEPPWSTRKRWAAAAPPVPLTPPLLEKVSERDTPEGRLVSLRLRMRGADVLRLRARPEARLRSAGIGTAARDFGTAEEDGDDFILRCHGRACDGARIDLLVGAPGPVEVTVMGVRNGLPATARRLVAARPANAAPQYSADSSIALARVKL